MDLYDLLKRIGILVIAGIILLFVLALLVIQYLRMCSQQFNAFSAGITAFFTTVVAIAAAGAAIFAYQTWKKERILELTKEYDKLAKRRRAFWDNLDQVYSVFRLSDSGIIKKKPDSMSDKEWCRTKGKAVELIRCAKCAKDVYPPPPFDPKNIGDRKDLLYWADKIEDKLKGECKREHKDQKALWDFAKFMYPGQGDFRTVPLSVTFEEKLFDEARGDLSRFWNKWASSPYSFRHLYKNYRSAHEQLIMLTWLELALVRRVGEHGKGKVELFKLAQKINQKYKQRRGVDG